MGTTITLALFEDGIVSIGHVGDSRAYLIRDRKVEQLTEDHSLVAELVRTGRLSPEEAETHPQRSVITRALGTDPDVDVDTFSIEAKPGDLFLICSDGLTSMVGRRDDPRRRRATARRHRRGREGARRGGKSTRRRGQHHRRLLRGRRGGAEAPSETKPMPALDEEPAERADEDTLTEADRVPAVDTMVVPPEQARRVAAEIEPQGAEAAAQRPGGTRRRRDRRRRRLALLVYWLLGQSQ